MRLLSPFRSRDDSTAASASRDPGDGQARFGQRRERALVGIFAGVLASFIVAESVEGVASSAIASLSDAIANKSSPSVAILTHLRGDVVDVDLTVGQLVRGELQPPIARPRLSAARAEIAEGLSTYAELPRFPGEGRHLKAVLDAFAHFDEAARRAEKLAATDRAGAARDYLENVRPAAERVLSAAMNGIEFNAEQGRDRASQIGRIYTRAVWLGSLLTAVCVALGVSGGVLIRRLSLSRRRLLEIRAAELEAFAGRVAHDIRNPLATAHLAAQLLRQQTSDQNAADKANRILNGLNRADALITGLLAFAQAGARPEPGARVDVRVLLSELLPSLSAEAELAHVELSVEPVPPVKVACSPGVYLSLVGNLTRNAMKYMGNQAVRRVTVRVSHDHAWVKTEVTDTGVGIAPESIPHLFEPWFRVHLRGGPAGFGLGLATVKRLAEGHGGSAGVRSSPGRGSTFWFVLPLAGFGSEQDDAGAPGDSPAQLPH